jgi:hypothetical protein
MNDDNTLEANEAQFESRNNPIQQTIDALAQYEKSEIEEHGMKAQIAREHGLEEHRVHYVLSHYRNLVRHRRSLSRDPVDPDAVKAAYDDETMKQMAASDGGQTTVSIDFTLDEAFRAMKLLPGDMGLNVYRQLLTSDFDRETLRRELED